MRRSIFGASAAMVRQLAATVAADQPAAQQAATAANIATTAAQQATAAATAAGQLAAQALANNATLADTVAALNRLSQDYVTAVKASADDRAVLHKQLDAQALAITALQGRKVAIGRAANVVTPALVLNGTADVTVALSRTMPGVDYDVEIAPALALLGKVTLTVKTRTATTVVVTVKATVAVSASSIDVTAYQLTPLTP